MEALEPRPGELILEVGAGEGVLTRQLSRLPNEIVAVEIDPELVARLRTEFGDRLQVVHDDATAVELPSGPFRAAGNLPYNVATPIIRRVLTSPGWRRCVFMVQKEVGDRLTAKIGDEAYGYLTLLTRLFAETRKLMTLEPGSFFPRPKVRSTVVIFDPADRRTQASREDIAALLSAGFRMRRKKLLNNLDGFGLLERTDAAKMIERAGLKPEVRAEEMSLQDFDRLAATIGSRGGESNRQPRPESHL